MTLDVALSVNRGAFSLHAEFTAPAAGVTAIFGASGAGKTTLLRAIAGLEPAHGRLAVAGATWQDAAHSLPAHRRPLGYVFQEPSLFAHLNVADNLRYGERRLPPAKRRIEFATVVTLLGLEALLGRSAAALSGGERQRVAIGRALLRSPELLLMDEPLAALDQPRKRELLRYLQAMQRQLNLPVLYVSHVVEEVAQLADQLVLLDGGKTVATGPVTDMLTRLDLPLAADADAGAVINGTAQAYDPADQLNSVSFAGGELLLGSPVALPRGPVKVRVLARDVSLTLERQRATSILNIVPAVVCSLQATPGGQCNVLLDCSGARLLARVSQRSVSKLGLQPGTAVFAQIKAAALLTS
jgi:molybdate transport system ATP-binding protein